MQIEGIPAVMGILVRCSLEVKAKSNTAIIRFYLDYRALTKEQQLWDFNVS